MINTQGIYFFKTADVARPGVEIGHAFFALGVLYGILFLIFRKKSFSYNEKIFLFELNKDITKLISDAIKNEFNDEVHAISNIDEALKEVSLGDYDLMIVRNKTKDSEQNTEKFIGALSGGGIATSIISIGEVSIESDHLIGHVEDKFNVSTLIELMKAHFDNSEDQSYIQIEIDVINLLEKSTQDFFSMKRPGKPDQYVLKVKPGESIEEVRKVEEKGFKNLLSQKKKSASPLRMISFPKLKKESIWIIPIMKKSSLLGSKFTEYQEN